MLIDVQEIPKISKFHIENINQKVNRTLVEKNSSLEINFLHFYFLKFPLFIIFNFYCLFRYKLEPEDVMVFEENINNSKNICILKSFYKKFNNYMNYKNKKISKLEFLDSINFLIRFLSRFFEKNLSISNKFKKIVFLYFNYNSKFEYIFNFLLNRDVLLCSSKKSHNNHFFQSINKTLSFKHGYASPDYSNLFLTNILLEKLFIENKQNRFKFLNFFQTKCSFCQKISTKYDRFLKKGQYSTNINVLLQKLVQI